MARPTYKDFKEKGLRDPGVKADLAKIMHTQKSNISRLECGDNVSFPNLDTINRYARALGYKVNIDFSPI